jgi:hypothetical protein
MNKAQPHTRRRKEDQRRQRLVDEHVRCGNRSCRYGESREHPRDLVFGRDKMARRGRRMRDIGKMRRDELVGLKVIKGSQKCPYCS